MSDKIGIVAGGGALPARLIEACRRSDRAVFVVAILGHAEEAHVAQAPHAWVRLGEASKMVALMRANGVNRVVFAGSVRRPHSFSDLRHFGFPDRLALSFLIKEFRNFWHDDGVMRAVLRWMEQRGLPVTGPETVDPSLLATEGVYGRLAPDPAAWAEIARGIAAAQAIGRKDKGQGAVARGGRVLAVEGAAGTDAMIARAGRTPGDGGVLVKVKKPGQETRIDLPTVGPRTVRNAHAARLNGIAVEAGAALVLDREAVIATADAAGMFVVGVKVPDDNARADKPGAGPLIYLMAGEPSGDALGARLMIALRRATDGNARFAGIGGERMVAEGLASDFPMEELSVMGLAEVLPRARLILRRVRETVARIETLKPAAVVSIDATGFCFRVEKRLKAKGLKIPLIHYVAPMVWAWRPWKAKLVAGFLDHLMTLLPFEPPYFEKEGLKTTFVGHSVIEEGAERGDGAAFRVRHGIAAEAPVLAVLPGSRHGEVSRLLPVFAATLALMKERFPDLRVVVATVAGVAREVTAAATAWPVPAIVVRGVGEKYDAFAAADAAIAASGTVSLELALARCPMVIAYKVSPLTAWLLRRFFNNARMRYASLVNILADRAVIPEFLQEDCRADRLAPALTALLDDRTAQEAQISSAAPALAALGQGAEPPSLRAARVVLDVIAERTKPAPLS